MKKLKKVRLDVLPEKILDESYLNRDEARPHTWKRNNKFLIYDGEIKSEEYYEAVLMLAYGYWRNQKIKYTVSDERRFHIRYRNGWNGTDSLYDAWLLIESKRREQFNYEAFIEKYPLWEDFHKQREAKRKEREMKEANEVGCDKEDPNDDTSSDKAYSNDTEDHFNANTSQVTNSEGTLASTMDAEGMEAEHSEELQQAYQQQVDVEVDIQGQESSNNEERLSDSHETDTTQMCDNGFEILMT